MFEPRYLGCYEVLKTAQGTAHSCSSGDRQLEQVVAVNMPAVVFEIDR